MLQNTNAINKESKSKLIHASLILLVSVFIFKAVVFKAASDDSDFIKMLDNGSLLEVLSNRYLTWSGRIFIEAFLIKTIGIKYFPQIMIVASSWLLSYSMVKIAGIRHHQTSICIATIILICLSSHSSNQAVFWITGAYNYLVPISTGLYAFSIFLENNPSIKRSALSCFLIFLSCNNEQFGLSIAILVIPIIALRYKAKAITPRDASFFISILIGVSVVLLAPGNMIRASSESLINMPFYFDMGIADRFAIAVDRINGHLLYKNNYLILLCSIFTLTNAIRAKVTTFVRMPIILISSVYVLLFSFNEYPNDWFSTFINRNYSIFSDWSNPALFISLIFTLSLLVSFYTICFSMAQNSGEMIFLALAFIIGLLSVAMIGFSPTAYASGTRIMFIFNISLITGMLKVYPRIK